MDTLPVEFEADNESPVSQAYTPKTAKNDRLHLRH